jgi:hypothetical protein
MRIAISRRWRSRRGFGLLTIGLAFWATAAARTGHAGRPAPGPLAPVDFDGNGLSDVVVYRAGAWLFFDYQTGAPLSGVFTSFPPETCLPAPADFDGDGKVQFSQKCGERWFFYGPAGALEKTITTGWTSADVPVPADYDGDGRDDVVVFRDGAWLWYDYATGAYDSARSIFTGAPPHFTGGTPTPVPMDYDGDGKADYTVYSGGPWHFYARDGTYLEGIWTGSIPGDIPVAGNYHGQGRDEVVVWRAGAWLAFDFASGAYDPSRSAWTGAPPHATGGVPLPAPLDVDGDGQLELTVYSGGPWHFFQPDGSYDRGVWCGAVAGDLPISRRLLP